MALINMPLHVPTRGCVMRARIEDEALYVVVNKLEQQSFDHTNDMSVTYNID